MTEDTYMDEIVGRSAPRWAWDLIDETLEMDANDQPISRDDVREESK